MALRLRKTDPKLPSFSGAHEQGGPCGMDEPRAQVPESHTLAQLLITVHCMAWPPDPLPQSSQL